MGSLGTRWSQHSFAVTPTVAMARSNFDRSFTVKDTFDFDYLIPCFVDEIIPGDTCNLNVNAFARLASAQKVPIMDNLYIDFFFFYVPNRLVWTNWERFMGAKDDPDDTTTYVVPTVSSGAMAQFEVGTLYDKFGLPTDVNNIEVNALPIRAYNLIYNEWFRDQNLQDSVVVDKDDGPDTVTDYALLKRGKRFDYFTSCLTAPQKGVAVEMPLGDYAPVTGIAPTQQTYGATNVTAYETDGTASTTYAKARYADYSDGNYLAIEEDPGVGRTGWPNIKADLSSATGATINELREAWMIQNLLELDARGGTRYTEILMNHFNVLSPDFRLQRPEYLGGGSIRMNQHPVAQTSPTASTNALAQLGAFSTASTAGQQVGFTKSFVEHGYVIGLMCARADITYQQGLNRMWSRSTRLDFYWPKLQELSDQAVLNKEIYAQGTSADDDVFGYQERHGEYRYKPSEIHGEFRGTYSTPLDMYHMAQEFSALPELDAAFVVQSTPISRALAITDGPDVLMDLWFQYRHARPMVTYAVPATIGRF